MKYLYLLIMTLSSSGQSLFSKLYSDNTKIDGDNSPQVFNFLYSALIALITLVIAGFRLHPSGITWLLAAVAAVASTFYNLSIVKAAGLGPYPVFMVCSLFGGIIVPIAVELVAFRAEISVMTYIGTAVMLAAIALMTYTKEETKKLSAKFITHCVILFVVNGIFGAALTYQSNLLSGKESENTEFIFITYALSALLSLAIILAKNGKAAPSKMKIGTLPAIYTLACAASATVARYFSMICIATVGAAVACPVDNGGVMVLVALFSYFIFKEKQTPVQISGDVLAVVSIVLLSI